MEIPAHSSFSALLAGIIDDFRTAGVRPTPLAIISVATDAGWTDAQVGALVQEIAARPDLHQIAA